MDDDFEDQMVRIRADTHAFRQDVADMRRTLSDGLGGAADGAARRIESALLRAVRTGKLGFDDLKRTALGVLNDIARASIQNGLDAIFGGLGKGGNGGLFAFGSQLVGAFLGLPGRATGGPVGPGQAYRVGERGPELFVPAASGRIEPLETAGTQRDIRVMINLNTPRDSEPEALIRSSRQIARQVRRALEREH